MGSVSSIIEDPLEILRWHLRKRLGDMPGFEVFASSVAFSRLVQRRTQAELRRRRP